MRALCSVIPGAKIRFKQAYHLNLVWVSNFNTCSQHSQNELAEGLRKVSGKLGILFRMAEAALKSPKGQVEQVIFPVASERLPFDLLQEAKSAGPAFRREVRAVMKHAFQSHHRRMLPELLSTLEFRSSNELHHPILNAIAFIKSHLDQKGPFWPCPMRFPLMAWFRHPGARQ